MGRFWVVKGSSWTSSLLGDFLAGETGREGGASWSSWLRSVGVPVTTSASQSPRPPRAQSTAVCGL